jgi:hypothetical protein
MRLHVRISRAKYFFRPLDCHLLNIVNNLAA